MSERKSIHDMALGHKTPDIVKVWSEGDDVIARDEAGQEWAMPGWGEHVDWEARTGPGRNEGIAL